MKRKKVSGGKYFVTVVVAALAVLWFGCSKNLTTNTDFLYIPTQADASATVTLTDLQAGRDLFINNCGRCHSLYNPDNFPASSWKSIVPGMASRAGLSSVQTSQVTKYVTRGK
jgi:hypothetical protein